MKKNTNSEKKEMRREYDFSKGTRGKHTRQYREGHTAVRAHKEDGTITVRYFTQKEGAVMLDPDVKARPPNPESVNRALRSIMQRERQEQSLSISGLNF